MRKRLLPVLLVLILLLGLGGSAYWLFGGEGLGQPQKHGPAGRDAVNVGEGVGNGSSGRPTSTTYRIEGTTDAGGGTPQPDRKGSADSDADTGESPPPQTTEKDDRQEEPVAPEDEALPEGMARLTVTIKGRVVDNAGRGVAGAKVSTAAYVSFPNDSGARVLGNPNKRSWPTNENGDYTAVLAFTVAGPDDTPYTITATMTATAPIMAPEAEVSAEGLKPGDVRTGVDITMVAGGSIVGLVRDELGNPLAGLAVFAVLRGGDTTRKGRASSIVGARYDVVTGKDGRYRIPAIKEGVWHLSALSSTHGSIKTSPLVTVVAGRETTADDIVFGIAVTVKMRVVDESGQPVAAEQGKKIYAEARLYLETNMLRTQLQIDDTGAGTVVGVPVETKSISLILDGNRQSEPVEVSLLPNAENDIGEVRVKVSRQD